MSHKNKKIWCVYLTDSKLRSKPLTYDISCNIKEYFTRYGTKAKVCEINRNSLWDTPIYSALNLIHAMIL